MRLKSAINAIGHPIRRDIIKRLRKEPLSAGELSQSYDVSKPSMSMHFKTLKDAQFIYSERAGNHIIYHLDTTVAEEALLMIAELLGSDNTGDDNENTL